jgi:SagB-type dehydrogenase family enzyme
MKKYHTWLKNEGLAYSILTKNAYNTRTPHIKSIGFRMASLQYSERHQLDNLAENFLINSYLKRNQAEIETSISSYLTDDGIKMVSLTGKEDLSAYHVIDLGEGAFLDIALGDAIVRRRSTRDFTHDPIPLDCFATLLRTTAGISASAEVNSAQEGDKVEFNLRTVPSGGGLYPIDLYVGVLNVKTLPSGIYHYQAIEDKLIEIGNNQKFNQLLKSFSGDVDMIKSSNASAAFLYVAKPWRSMRKYGNRGLRFVFQEIGSMSQNLHLAVAGLGLGSVDCASFFEDDAHNALNLDGMYQCLLHSILVGSIA